jgi:hypothetical protein
MGLGLSGVHPAHKPSRGRVPDDRITQALLRNAKRQPICNGRALECSILLTIVISLPALPFPAEVNTVDSRCSDGQDPTLKYRYNEIIALSSAKNSD